MEHCSTSNDAITTTISKSNNDNDYLNDVEMENNSHTTNGKLNLMAISGFKTIEFNYYWPLTELELEVKLN